MLALPLLLCTVAACRPTEDTAAPLVTPSVALPRGEVVIGSPIEMTYRFAVAPGASFSEDYTVFVHFLDSAREIMWTDDHQPPTPTSQWKGGSTIEYARTMFVPKFPYTGETRVELGLVSAKTGERVPMAAESPGLREYLVGTFTLASQGDAHLVVFKDGWQPVEVAAEGLATEWQWSRREGVLSFRNPQRDATLFLRLDQPLKEAGPQHVQIRLGQAVVDSFEVVPGTDVLRKTALSKDQLGTADMIDIVVAVERTFVPASLPGMNSRDTRELGVRVFRAYLQPK